MWSLDGVASRAAAAGDAAPPPPACGRRVALASEAEVVVEGAAAAAAEADAAAAAAAAELLDELPLNTARALSNCTNAPASTDRNTAPEPACCFVAASALALQSTALSWAAARFANRARALEVAGEREMSVNRARRSGVHMLITCRVMRTVSPYVFFEPTAAEEGLLTLTAVAGLATAPKPPAAAAPNPKAAAPPPPAAGAAAASLGAASSLRMLTNSALNALCSSSMFSRDPLGGACGG